MGRDEAPSAFTRNNGSGCGCGGVEQQKQQQVVYNRPPNRQLSCSSSFFFFFPTDPTRVEKKEPINHQLPLVFYGGNREQINGLPKLGLCVPLCPVQSSLIQSSPVQASVSLSFALFGKWTNGTNETKADINVHRYMYSRPFFFKE